MLDQFDFSIYINGLVIQSSQIIASIFSAMVVFRFRRRLFGFVCFGAVVVCSMALVFIWDQDKEEEEGVDLWGNVAVLAFIFVIEFAITAEFNCFLVYIN
jgi:hypothetical protein